jgi:hypothetical protein
MLQVETQSFLPWNESDLAYTSVATAGNTNVTIATYSRYDMGTKEAARSNGVYLATDDVITFSLAGPGAVVPKPRDRVAIGGKSSVVITTDDNRFLKYWKLVCRNVSLSYQLNDTATILRSVPSPQADGLRLRNATTLASDVACRLQPEDWVTETTDARRTKVSNYTAFLETEMVLQVGDTIQVGGVQYEVTGQSDIQNIDGLNRTACQRIS